MKYCNVELCFIIIFNPIIVLYNVRFYVICLKTIIVLKSNGTDIILNITLTIKKMQIMSKLSAGYIHTIQYITHY